MKKGEMKTYSLEELTDKHIGKRGTDAREAFENELRLDLLGEAIKQARKERKMTQEELGRLVGVQKAQGSGDSTVESLRRRDVCAPRKRRHRWPAADSGRNGRVYGRHRSGQA